MKAMKRVGVLLLILISNWGSLVNAQGPAKDTAFFNNNGAGIPNSGNTIYPNNGPEFPHSAPSNPTTDPGPLYHYGSPGGYPPDTVPHN
jgi:hypothetical protein